MYIAYATQLDYSIVSYSLRYDALSDPNTMVIHRPKLAADPF